jgi:hypothetical protein
MFADLKADSTAWKKEGTKHYSESKTHNKRKKNRATDSKKIKTKDRVREYKDFFLS